MSKRILVSGGAGYIGSHTVVELLNNGYEVVIVDDFSNSNKRVIEAIENITKKKVILYEADLKNQKEIFNVFEKEKINAVIHLASYKAVGESVADPIKYYENNLIGSIYLLKAMKEYNLKNLIFSSSATIYGQAEQVPIPEESKIGATNPYGRSKLIIESVLKDLAISDSQWNIISLRYFNPLGAHPSGKIGEDSNDIPNNLVPNILQVAVGNLDCVKIFGGDYDTPDGTGIRDYVHIMDLAEGHIKALEKIFTRPNGYEVYNLGSEKGYSVFDIIRCFEQIIGKKIPYKIIERRSGDIAVSYADVSKAKKVLKWKAKRDIIEMCKDAWRWQSIHSNRLE